MEAVIASTSVGDIWSLIGSARTDHGAKEGAAAAGRNNLPGINACWKYLDRCRCMLGKFGRIWSPFRIFGHDWRQFRMSMPRPRSWEVYDLVNTEVDSRTDVERSIGR